jgi:small subunit ribosomal protein S1
MTVEQKTLAECIEGDYDYVRPRSGDVQEGLIASIDEDELLIHLAEAKRDGVVSVDDLKLLDEDFRAALSVGDSVPVRILRGITRDGQIVASISQGLRYSDWLRAEDLLESGERVEAEVTGVNRGGLQVSFGRIRGFVPNSHLRRGRSRKHEAKEELVGQTLSLTVLEVNQRRRRLVLSERAGDERTRRRLLEELEPGQVRRGVVRRITHYGAFVDVGGMDGLLHVSELDHKYVKHPNDVLQVGEEIEVLVLKVDRERQRISLSRKRLLPDTWDEVTENLFIGDLIVGTVTSVVEYGAFVDVGAGVQGLLHVSEIPNRQLGLSELETGSQVDVRVRSIDRQRHRISLTMNGRFAVAR